jgi:hypothetical protein
MIRWLATAFRHLLMSRTERYLGHAIDRSDFERRLQVCDGGYNQLIGSAHQSLRGLTPEAHY